MTFTPDKRIYIGPYPITSIAFGSALASLVKVGGTEIVNFVPQVQFSPLAVMLTSGSSYIVPTGATSMKAWAIGSGGNTDRGAGGTAYKTWAVNGGDSVSYSVGAASANDQYNTLGNNTTLTYSGTTITGCGGGRRANGTTVMAGGEFSGGDGGANGGAGGYFGAGNYAAGAVGGNTTIGTGQSVRFQATDVNGLFAVLTLLGINYTLPPTYSFNTNPNIFGAGSKFNKYGEYASGGIGGANGSNTSETRETGAVILYFT